MVICHLVEEKNGLRGGGAETGDEVGTGDGAEAGDGDRSGEGTGLKKGDPSAGTGAEAGTSAMLWSKFLFGTVGIGSMESRYLVR